MNNATELPIGGKPPGTNSQQASAAILGVIALVVGGGMLLDQLQTKPNRSSNYGMKFYQPVAVDNWQLQEVNRQLQEANRQYLDTMQNGSRMNHEAAQRFGDILAQPSVKPN